MIFEKKATTAAAAERNHNVLDPPFFDEQEMTFNYVAPNTPNNQGRLAFSNKAL